MTIDSVFAAFYAGKDSAPGDRNPYPEGTACRHAWAHGHEREHGGTTRPMTDAEVAEAFAALNGHTPC